MPHQAARANSAKNVSEPSPYCNCDYPCNNVKNDPPTQIVKSACNIEGRLMYPVRFWRNDWPKWLSVLIAVFFFIVQNFIPKAFSICFTIESRTTPCAIAARLRLGCKWALAESKCPHTKHHHLWVSSRSFSGVTDCTSPRWLKKSTSLPTLTNSEASASGFSDRRRSSLAWHLWAAPQGRVGTP